MPCNERCGRIKFKMNGTPMTYYMCAPYAICAGFGMAATEGLTYNPPQDEEIEAYCCSATDNCNVDDPNIQINTTYLPTAAYPTICYGGIWVNGVPITNSAYGLCQGECASANFLTTFAGQTHNATIYTCDPVTMCSTYGIKNGCGQIGNGVTGCCCDYDGCLDPNRGGGNFNPLRCYSGISVLSDGILEGGDMFCSGMCSSLSTVVNSKNVTTYWCAPFDACRYFGLGLGGNDNCNSITGADPPVTGCCNN
ncbi:hypothetical protein WR25_00622 [Diploscapter pachys]|uniref:ET module n=1 Tax=Diploscapter pachys TaxID=2018661 RepID=A0A2A2LLM4_9BILA|nr:hypothetical protein WR25_00622 [Diploscapter pachys]